MDKKAIEYHVRGLLEAIGEDPDREGLAETPERVARMLEEVLEGTAYTNHEIAQMFGKTFSVSGEDDSAVIIKDITVFSYCEHHLALMYDMKVNVGYIPNGKVLGLSKIARICEMAAKRLQLAAGTEDVAVMIRGYHSCMTARGIKNASAKTETAVFRGRFKNDAELKRMLSFE